MILLQASTIWSAGVVSVVQRGPSWLRDWAEQGADHSAVASRQNAKNRRRIGPRNAGDVTEKGDVPLCRP
jgi:hypothetical protein